MDIIKDVLLTILNNTDKINEFLHEGANIATFGCFRSVCKKVK